MPFLAARAAELDDVVRLARRRSTGDAELELIRLEEIATAIAAVADKMRNGPGVGVPAFGVHMPPRRDAEGIPVDRGTIVPGQISTGHGMVLVSVVRARRPQRPGAR